MHGVHSVSSTVLAPPMSTVTIGQIERSLTRINSGFSFGSGRGPEAKFPLPVFSLLGSMPGSSQGRTRCMGKAVRCRDQTGRVAISRRLCKNTLDRASRPQGVLRVHLAWLEATV
jgi:hypothetical protein